ncbi:hypothetical protein [Octadecabacter antarcticus]|uniref:hypothetical protein n=1 Tax=Octadecabacter antarcticus TaxID=1217908 RepID=UPI00018060FA|nr:hypothetical protein [Octadecabacter antarcticus]
MIQKPLMSGLSGRQCQSKTFVVAKKFCLPTDWTTEALPTVRVAWKPETFQAFLVTANYAGRC